MGLLCNLFVLAALVFWESPMFRPSPSPQLSWFVTSCHRHSYGSDKRQKHYISYIESTEFFVALMSVLHSGSGFLVHFASFVIMESFWIVAVFSKWRLQGGFPEMTDLPDLDETFRKWMLALSSSVSPQKRSPKFVKRQWSETIRKQYWYIMFSPLFIATLVSWRFALLVCSFSVAEYNCLRLARSGKTAREWMLAPSQAIPIHLRTVDRAERYDPNAAGTIL